MGMTKGLTLAVATALLAGAANCPCSGEEMYAVTAVGTHKGTLLSVDTETGQTQVVGPAGMGANLLFTVSLAVRPSDGTFFVDNNTSPNYGLSKIDRITGLATPIGVNFMMNELTFDTAGRQPITGICARRHHDFKTAVGVANDFLAGKSVSLDRIGHQLAVEIVKRQRPEAGRRGNARKDHVASPVERAAVVVG